MNARIQVFITIIHTSCLTQDFPLLYIPIRIIMAYSILKNTRHCEVCVLSNRTEQLFTDFKKTYDSVRREVLYNILVEFRAPMELVMLIKICLSEMYSKVHTGKNFV
jgi:hypothetical protein